MQEMLLDFGRETASVHQVAKLVAALLRKVMAAYRWVYDSRHLQADCKDQLRNYTLGNRVWATFTFYLLTL